MVWWVTWWVWGLPFAFSLVYCLLCFVVVSDFVVCFGVGFIFDVLLLCLVDFWVVLLMLFCLMLFLLVCD